MRQLRVTRRTRVRRDDDMPVESLPPTRSAPCGDEDACEALLLRIAEALSEV